MAAAVVTIVVLGLFIVLARRLVLPEKRARPSRQRSKTSASPASKDMSNGPDKACISPNTVYEMAYDDQEYDDELVMYQEQGRSQSQFHFNVSHEQQTSPP
jgi:hypothetical protein